MMPRDTAVGNRDLLLAAAGVGACLAARSLLRRRRELDLRDQVGLITGGSRGLGLVIARQLGAEGARVVIAARSGEELDRAREDLKARGIDAIVIPCNVGDRADARRLIDEVVAQTGRIDILINNAGIIQAGPLEHMQLQDFEEAMSVHFWGPLYTILAAVPVMREHGGGRIVNISSIGGKIGVPHLAPYCASKFALTGLSDSVRGELAKDNIFVTTVCPGMMRTGSPYNAWFKGRHREEFTWFVISDSIPMASISGERAAAQVIDAARHGDAELVITWPAKLAVMFNAMMPEAVALGMSLANRLILPAPTDESGDRARSGWQSLSDWAPSKLTALTDRAAAANNELPH
jgi:NAD(P)-dependent dehydrogenase (short-subunit alcohol dehydrogenase family)